MINERVQQLRKYLKNNNLYAVIVPSNDPHFGEYIQDYYKCREWISGFDGSAATVVITIDEAALWTDSRYFIQAESQLEGSGITLKKIKVPGNETIEQWLQNRYILGSRVGIDADLFSINDYNILRESLKPYSLDLIDDPFKNIWIDRPKKVNKKIFLYDIDFSGEDTKSKHQKLNNLIECSSNYSYIITACEEVAWLCNIRGSDIEYNPLPMLYSIVEKDKIRLFSNKNSISEADSLILREMNVFVEDYDSFKESLKSIPEDHVRIASGDKISAGNYFELTRDGARFLYDKSRGGYITGLKSQKNEVEQKGFRKAHILDGVAWVKYLKYIEDNYVLGNPLTESQLAGKLIEFRKESEYYVGESFEPIVAYGLNGAMPHYSISKDKQVYIGNGFLLTDMGAHYLFGTTDTTRTLYFGTPTHEEKTDYTSVLKGMINLSMAIFPKGTRGSSLDILARGQICSNEKLYMHGTGHGVGHFLPVHEGPQSIRMEENPVALVPGMVQSNEPAVYVKGKYGIRTENIILCRAKTINDYGTFYDFETLTFVPIDKTAIDLFAMEKQQIEWLNNYHKEVYEKLAQYLDKSEKEWLARKTTALNKKSG